jgi:hypothetical protein
MSRNVLGHLWDALNFDLKEILHADFWLGLVGGSGAATLGVVTPSALLRGVAVATGLVGVIIGAVIAGVAVQAAFMDQAFLQKLRAIGREPVRYLAPFLFTAVIGVFAMVGLIILSTLSPQSQIAILGVVGGLAGFFTVWTMMSLLYCFATLVQFMGLKMDALDDADE